MTYQERREKLYVPLQRDGIFTWDRLYGEEYALADVYAISRQDRDELACASERLGRVFARTVQVAQKADDELLRVLGIPEAAWNAVRLPGWEETTTVIGRFDFARTLDGWKMLEYNSDTPTGIVEAFYVNGEVCAQSGLADPNEGVELHLREALCRAIARYEGDGYSIDRIVFSALDWHEEDAGTTKYLLRVSGLNARFVPLSALRVHKDRLCVQESDGRQTPIDVWYRLHALETLAYEKAADGYPTGAHVLDLIARKKLAVINPPGAFLAQAKGMQALIWSLYEAEEFFDACDRETIGRYMLPTYFENPFHGREAYAAKPIFGREGSGVTLYDAEGRQIESNEEPYYSAQPMIYQKFASLETVKVETEKGPYEGSLLWGSFLIGGRASAVIARVGGLITGNLSYYLPVGLRTQTEKDVIT